MTTSYINAINLPTTKFTRLSRVAVPLAIAVAVILFIPITHAQSSDFKLASTPSFLCTNPGVDSSTVISIQSINGFAGNVALNYQIDPTANNSPSLSSPPSSQDVSNGQTVRFTLTILTTSTTPTYTYRITISGFSAGLLHFAYVELTVSRDCSVGGSLLPTTTPPPMTTYVAIAAATGAVLAITTLLAYRRGTARPRL